MEKISKKKTLVLPIQMKRIEKEMKNVGMSKKLQKKVLDLDKKEILKTIKIAKKGVKFSATVRPDWKEIILRTRKFAEKEGKDDFEKEGLFCCSLIITITQEIKKLPERKKLFFLINQATARELMGDNRFEEIVGDTFNQEKPDYIR